MRVNQVIAQLKELDPHAEVVVRDFGGEALPIAFVFQGCLEKREAGGTQFRPGFPNLGAGEIPAVILKPR